MHYRVLLVSVVFAFSAVPANADPFMYADFSSTAGLKLNGLTSVVNNELRLVPASPTGSGSAFTTTLTSLGNLSSFSTYFQFRITGSAGAQGGADGLVFVIQTQSNSVGGLGGGLGYAGITPSLGIEFDTYDNGSGAPYFDPNGNHVGIDRNGAFTNRTATEPIDFNNGRIWNVWIDYNGVTDGLEVRWSLLTTRPANAQLTDTVNLPGIVGNSAFLGFTAGDAAGVGNHDILNWQFRDQFAPIGSAVPEPASTAVFAAVIGLLGLGRLFRPARSAARV